MEFSYTDFLQVFKYLQDFLDWEKTPKAGKFYCRCKILHLFNTIHAKSIMCTALFINIAIQAKKQDAATEARGDLASREHFIRFWDVFPTDEAHHHVGKHYFAIQNDICRGQRRSHKLKDSSLQRAEILDPGDDGF